MGKNFPKCQKISAGNAERRKYLGHLGFPGTAPRVGLNSLPPPRIGGGVAGGHLLHQSLRPPYVEPWGLDRGGGSPRCMCHLVGLRTTKIWTGDQPRSHGVWKPQSAKQFTLGPWWPNCSLDKNYGIQNYPQLNNIPPVFLSSAPTPSKSAHKKTGVWNIINSWVYFVHKKTTTK